MWDIERWFNVIGELPLTNAYLLLFIMATRTQLQDLVDKLVAGY